MEQRLVVSRDRLSTAAAQRINHDTRCDPAVSLNLAIDTCFCTSAWLLSKQQTPQARRLLLLLHAAIGSGQLVVSKGVGSH